MIPDLLRHAINDVLQQFSEFGLEGYYSPEEQVSLQYRRQQALDNLAKVKEEE